MSKQFSTGSLKEFLASAECDVFRLEQLPEYDSSNERRALMQFKATGEVVLPDGYMEYCQRVATDVSSGKRHRRLRVVPDTPSDYVTFELGVFTALQEAGAEIRILSESEYLSALGLSGRVDYYLLDQARLIVMNYDSDGRFIDATENPGAAKRFANLTAALWRRARPLTSDRLAKI